jgi:hypothetical protein
MKRKPFFALMFLLSSQAMAAEPVMLKSSVQQATLLELYTSEGCSSCPSADRWLSGFKTDPRLWQQVIPVAFHVDYWNYLGWEDPYSSQRYSQRQRNYHNFNYLKSVYTPGFVKNGREWRTWFGMRQLKQEETANVGVLSLTLKNNTLNLDFEPEQAKHKKLQANIVLLGFDIQHAIGGGENQGKTLHHDFVVLNFENKILKKNADRYNGQWPWPNKTQATQKHAIAVWLSTPQDPTPLQAVGGWL